MGVLTSMSDIRTKLLLGTSIGALAMVFTMAAGVDVLNTESGTAMESGKILGHVTALAVHPDGSMQYLQTDNLLNNPGLDGALVHLFSAGGNGAFNCIRMGSGAAGTLTVMNTNLVGTGASCDTTADGNDDVLSTVQTATGTPAGATLPAKGDIVVEFGGLAANDLIQTAATTVAITEVTLQDSAGLVLSHVGIDPAIAGVLGTVVTITYTMELS